MLADKLFCIFSLIRGWSALDIANVNITLKSTTRKSVPAGNDSVAVHSLFLTSLNCLKKLI